MRKIDLLLEEYGESHQNPTNKLIHWICVPVIFWSITALLWKVKLGFIIPETDIELNATMIALVAVAIYYLLLSPSLMMGMFLFSIVCVGITYQLEQMEETSDLKLWIIALSAFVIAWIFQFVGHKIEGKKPSFFKDLQFLLVGPAWLMHFIFKRVGLYY
ncbi:MAG: hypothetical protein RL264_1986 [Bacteroidota bacterium]|jgi:uncharacterized membrane protein YGL010W